MTSRSSLSLPLLLGILSSLADAQNCPGGNQILPPRELGRIRANRLNAITGLAASELDRGVLWVHNRRISDASWIDARPQFRHAFTSPGSTHAQPEPGGRIRWPVRLCRSQYSSKDRTKALSRSDPRGFTRNEFAPNS